MYLDKLLLIHIKRLFLYTFNMSKANRSGVLLEGLIFDILKTYQGINITKQFPLNDIFGTSKVDFKIDYKGRSFFIEAKNQIVSGSVDQKLPFYLENIRENRYPGHFVFVLNGNGIRNGALSYLKRKQLELNFSIIDFDNISTQLKNLLEYNEAQTVNLRVKPIIKWAGGKRMIMDDIKKLFPQKIEHDYHEPFCGGFSVACELYNTDRFGKNTTIYLNDSIPQLITLYEVVKEAPLELIEVLKDPKYTVNAQNFEQNKERYNSNAEKSNIEIAALFLFLNKAGYNGVYRENKDGKYNVPFCKKENIKLYEEENLMTMSLFLQRCQLSSSDYKQALNKVKEGDTVYCDPPYYNTFNSYSKEKFDGNSQITLSQRCIMLKDKANVMVSNSDEPFIYELYSNCNIHRIPVKRVVNNKGEERSNVIHELFIEV